MTRAQALLAVARLASVESDDYLYRYPRVPEEQEEGCRLYDVSQAAFADANASGATDGDWPRVIAWLEGEEI